MHSQSLVAPRNRVRASDHQSLIAYYATPDLTPEKEAWNKYQSLESAVVYAHSLAMSDPSAAREVIDDASDKFKEGEREPPPGGRRVKRD